MIFKKKKNIEDQSERYDLENLFMAQLGICETTYDGETRRKIFEP